MTEDEERRAFFDTLAEGWEDRNYPDEIREGVKAFVAALNLDKGVRVLDVGCGTGVLIPYLREVIGPRGQIVALDPSEAMLKGAASKDRGRAVPVWAAAESMPLIGESVDIVVCFAAFPHFSDRARAVREFFRVLRPGGKAVVAHLLNRDELKAHHGRHHAVAEDRLPDAQTMYQIFRDAGFARTRLDERPGWYFFSAEKGKGR